MKNPFLTFTLAMITLACAVLLSCAGGHHSSGGGYMHPPAESTVPR